MEIVINTCCGRFGLSTLGEKEYLKQKGKESFFYKQTKYDYSSGNKEFVRMEPTNKEEIFSYTYMRDLGDKITELLNNDEDYFYYGDIKRDDPDLIAVVKKLGKKVNGGCAELKIVEIPDDVEWIIDEYDGVEWVAEKHRTWE